MQIRNLNKEILCWKRELLELEEESTVSSPKFDEPTAISPGKFNSTVENRAVMLAEKKAAIERLEERVERERIEILEYLQTVNDTILRQIILYRCLRGYSWQRVATEIGGGNTADGLRMIFNRNFPM